MPGKNNLVPGPINSPHGMFLVDNILPYIKPAKYCMFILLILSSLLVNWGCNHNKEIEKEKADTTVQNVSLKMRWLAQWYGEGKKELLIKELAREFSFLNQNVEIEIEFPHEMLKMNPGSSKFLPVVDSITNMVKQNEWPYDIMLCDADIYNNVAIKLNDPYWGKKFLVDFINEPWFTGNHKDNLFKTSNYTDKFGGIAPGAYIEGIWKLMYVSSEVEKKLGIKVKLTDMNTSDFISYAKAVYDYNQQHDDKITFFTYPYESNSFFTQLVLSSVQKETVTNKEDALLAMKEVYQVLEQISAYKPLQKYFSYDNPFTLSEDKVLFSFHYSWVYILWQKNNPEGVKKMHPCEIPSIADKKAFCYAGNYNSVFVVPKNSKNSKVAEDFMKFITSPETAEKWTKYSQCPTGLKSRIEFYELSSNEFSKFAQHIKEKYNDNLFEIQLNSFLFHTTKNIDFQFERIINGEINSETALRSLLAQVR